MEPNRRLVRIDGDPDPWEVLCETATTLVLVNRTARLREQVADLEAQLATTRRTLEEMRRRQDAAA